MYSSIARFVFSYERCFLSFKVDSMQLQFCRIWCKEASWHVQSLVSVWQVRQRMIRATDDRFGRFRGGDCCCNSPSDPLEITITGVPAETGFCTALKWYIIYYSKEKYSYRLIFRLKIFSSCRRKHSLIDNWPDAGRGRAVNIHWSRASHLSWHKNDSAWVCLQKRQIILNSNFIPDIADFTSISEKCGGFGGPPRSVLVSTPFEPYWNGPTFQLVPLVPTPSSQELPTSSEQNPIE